MIIQTPVARRRRAFTLMELMVVNVLMGLLMVLIAGAWRAFGPICVEVIARSRLAGEANVAAFALHNDMNPATPLTLSSIQPNNDGSSFTMTYSDQSTVTYSFVPPTDYSATPLQSNYADGRLVRQAGTGPSVTIAKHVDAMAVLNDQSNPVNLTISFFYRGSRSQYTFQAYHQ
jgi:prepilin-type N-terminal cleavage/methylation domain-containing protein